MYKMALLTRGMEARNLIIVGDLASCGLNKDNMLRSTTNLILIDSVHDFNIFNRIGLTHWDTLVPYTENSKAFKQRMEGIWTNKFISKDIYHTCVKNIGRSRQRLQYTRFEDAQVAEFASSLTP